MTWHAIFGVSLGGALMGLAAWWQATGVNNKKGR